jgi:hypothetical protein
MTAAVGSLNRIIPSVFADRASAEKAIVDLRDVGFAEDELGVIVPDPAHHDLIDDTTHQALEGVEQGMLVGAPVGALAGIALAALAAPGIGVLGVGGALLFGGHLGALWGVVAGAYLGLTARVHHIEDAERKYEVPLKPGEILVTVVTDQDRADVVTELIERDGGHLVRATA